MTGTLLGTCLGALLLMAASCGGGGGGGDSTATTSATPGDTGSIATLSGLQAQLASVLLQQADVPDGLEGSSPSFSTNLDVAGQNNDVMQTLIKEGRQLGVDVQFIPTDRLDPGSPLRGGVQTSASVYGDTPGASQSFQDTAAQARANNWAANYPDFQDIHVTEVQHTFGDESLWLRIDGKEQCSSTQTPAPPASPSTLCGEQQLVKILDNVIMRVGRVRAFLQVSTLFPGTAATNSFEDQVQQWAETVAKHANTAFPTP
jgi:hypothetical protein